MSEQEKTLVLGIRKLLNEIKQDSSNYTDQELIYLWNLHAFEGRDTDEVFAHVLDFVANDTHIPV